MIIGHCDGAFYMLGILKQAFPEAQFIENPAPQTQLDFLVFSLFGNTHQKYRNVKKILLSGEPNPLPAISCHVIIDCKKSLAANVFYLPFYVTSFFERFQNTPLDLLKRADYRKTKFCAFLYSQDHVHRNRLFDQVNAYKKVDALGRCRNPNPNKATDRAVYRPGVCTYNDLAVGHYKPYKFVICAENTALPGYVTEKMISAMLANAIPIYWGAPDVAEHFNPKSFINTNDPNWLQRVQAIDQSPELYQQMLQEPWLSNNQLNSYFDFAASLRNRILATATATATAATAFKALKKRG